MDRIGRHQADRPPPIQQPRVRVCHHQLLTALGKRAQSDIYGGRRHIVADGEGVRSCVAAAVDGGGRDDRVGAVVVPVEGARAGVGWGRVVVGVTQVPAVVLARNGLLEVRGQLLIGREPLARRPRLRRRVARLDLRVEAVAPLDLADFVKPGKGLTDLGGGKGGGVKLGSDECIRPSLLE